MEHLYNPDQMPEQEIKDTFVARQALVDRLVALIQNQPEGAGVQHVVLVAPRGMGKTTILLMVQFALTDRGLAPPWLAVRFPEELYNVTDLADLWLETLESVSRSVPDPELAQKSQELQARYPDSERLQEAALALLRDWCRRNGRRLVLLIDNFQTILAQMDDERQSAALRNVLMNDGFLMVLGAAPSFFKEASDYDQPLYNFFRIERLDRLTFEDILALLRQRAAADGLTDFDKTLAANTTRLRVLDYFTGGNVRLVLMLYRILTRSDVSETRRDLELLLDQVTPFYKAKTEDLPPQQRKILDHIARRSGQIHEGISPSEIAQAVRLTPQVVSAQLKRLTEQGYVQPANLRGRNTFYTLSEPLYSLWYQMRFARNARERMGWLVEFLKGFYSREELGEQSSLLESRFQQLLDSGSVRQARNVLEHRRWIAEAMDDLSSYATTMDSVIRGFLTLNDIRTVKDQVLSGCRLGNLSPATLDQLVEAKCITSEQAVQAENAHSETGPAQKAAEAKAAYWMGVEALQQQQLDLALVRFDRALELDPQMVVAWGRRGVILGKLRRPEEARASFDQALAVVTEDTTTFVPAIYLGRFVTEIVIGRTEQAIQDWYAVISTGECWPEWTGHASETLLGIVQMGHTTFVRELIRDSQMEEQFFPLVRALDYLATGDEALIEKLTPEMRPIVEEVVASLRPAMEANDVPPAPHQRSPSGQRKVNRGNR